MQNKVRLKLKLNQFFGASKILDFPIESTQNLKGYHHRFFHRFAAGIHLHMCKSSLGRYLCMLHHKLLQVLRNCRDWEPLSGIHRYLYEVRRLAKRKWNIPFEVIGIAIDSNTKTVSHPDCKQVIDSCIRKWKKQAVYCIKIVCKFHCVSGQIRTCNMQWLPLQILKSIIFSIRNI